MPRFVLVQPVTGRAVFSSPGSDVGRTPLCPLPTTIHTTLGPAGRSASQITGVGLSISGTGSSANSDSSCSLVLIWFHKTFGNASRYYLILKREEADEQSCFRCLPWLSQGRGRARGLAGLYVRKLAGARSPHRAFSLSHLCFGQNFHYHSQGNALLKAVLFSWQLCSVSGEWL